MGKSKLGVAVGGCQNVTASAVSKRYNFKANCDIALILYRRQSSGDVEAIARRRAKRITRRQRKRRHQSLVLSTLRNLDQSLLRSRKMERREEQAVFSWDRRNQSLKMNVEW